MNDGCAEYLTGNAHHNDGRFSYVLFMGNLIFQEDIYMSKTIRELSEINGRVYIFLRTPELGRRFLLQAEQEGFTFGDGEKPTARQYAEVMAVNRDITINYVGTNGRIAYGGGAVKIGSEPLIRIDYEKLLTE